VRRLQEKRQINSQDHLLRDIGANRADIESEIFNSYH